MVEQILLALILAVILAHWLGDYAWWDKNREHWGQMRGQVGQRWRLWWSRLKRK